MTHCTGWNTIGSCCRNGGNCISAGVVSIIMTQIFSEMIMAAILNIGMRMCVINNDKHETLKIIVKQSDRQ